MGIPLPIVKMSCFYLFENFFGVHLMFSFPTEIYTEQLFGLQDLTGQKLDSLQDLAEISKSQQPQNHRESWWDFRKTCQDLVENFLSFWPLRSWILYKILIEISKSWKSKEIAEKLEDFLAISSRYQNVNAQIQIS